MPNPFVRKLQTLGPLSHRDCDALERAWGPTRSIEAHADVVEEGPAPPACTVLMEGLACRYKTLDDGRRQITAILIPGDILDASGFLLRRLDHSVGALTRCRVASVSHHALAGMMSGHPKVLLALWRETLLDAAVTREWLVAMGCRPAYERVAHLFCELAFRLRAAGLARQDSYPLPLTQEEMADALGLSVVHVNRILQRLRSERLITLRARRLTIHDWPAFQRVGGFDPRYLSVHAPPQPSGEDTQPEGEDSRPRA